MATLKEGDIAPNFSLTDNEGKFHSLNDYSGKINYFLLSKSKYSRCTAEACNLRDYFNDLKDKGYSILGVRLTQKKPAKLFKKIQLPFSFVSRY